ncbi:hypothetical protein [Streptomyces sp. NPDC005281]|uniref:hypothetical protein n=1 Tax=Streptomyces sp. NPDC005281 TaxID=3155712 RepID=UPI0033B70373
MPDPHADFHSRQVTRWLERKVIEAMRERMRTFMAQFKAQDGALMPDTATAPRSAAEAAHLLAVQGKHVHFASGGDITCLRATCQHPGWPTSAQPGYDQRR